MHPEIGRGVQLSTSRYLIGAKPSFQTPRMSGSAIDFNLRFCTSCFARRVYPGNLKDNMVYIERPYLEGRKLHPPKYDRFIRKIPKLLFFNRGCQSARRGRVWAIWGAINATGTCCQNSHFGY